MKVYFGKSSAKNVVTSSLSDVEEGLVSSEHDEIVGHKWGRQPTLAPDQKEAKVLLSSCNKCSKIFLNLELTKCLQRRRPWSDCFFRNSLICEEAVWSGSALFVFGESVFKILEHLPYGSIALLFHWWSILFKFKLVNSPRIAGR